jgi:outer membrane protein insertion porin family
VPKRVRARGSALVPSPSFAPRWLAASLRAVRSSRAKSLATWITFATLLLLVASAAWAQNDVISEINVVGNRRIPADTIRSRIFTKAGDIYDPSALERDFNSLWNTGYFEDIKILREQTPKGWRVIFQVKEKPTIRTIDYVGASSVSNSDILDRFKQDKVGLVVESQYDPTRIKKAEVSIKNLLSEHGRQFATIRTEVRQIPPAAVGITFVVKEGPKVKVGKIKFTGNEHIKSRILRAAMKNLKPIGIPHSIFLENIFAKTYDATKLEEDTERVRAEFQNRGYFKAVVADPKTEIHDTGTAGFRIPLLMSGPGKAVDITMPVEEGDQYRLGKITFKNNKALPNSAALRTLIPLKDGDIFSREKIAKGLDNLRKAYGDYGYINFSPVPNTTFDEDKKLINVEIDVDEGKKFTVRRIEFQGNTTTRDKVIRRELALEEGGVYSSRLWELSILRLNQLSYFDQLKADDPNTTEKKLDEKNGTVDLTLKVKEKGKNSIGLNGGVSGLEGAFIGLNYATNNFLGRGETLQVQLNLGNLARSVMLGFTQPYMFDRPLQFGATVFANRVSYNQARQLSIFSGQNLNLPSAVLQNLQNYSQSTVGGTTSVSYALRHSFKRVGITYSLDRSTLLPLSSASRNLFEFLAFRGISGPSAVTGIVTSKIFPNFSFNTLDSGIFPKSGHQMVLGAEFAGIGGTVHSIRPIAQYKQFFPMQNRRNTFAFNVEASFISGWGGLVAPPFQRFFMGGENDLRGFDIRSVSPVAFLPSAGAITLTNPNGSPVLKDPSNPSRGAISVPIPIDQIVFPGGDFSVHTNLEYRITIAGPVAIVPFVDSGIDPIIRRSQLEIATLQYDQVISTPFGCPGLDPTSGTGCTPGSLLNPSPAQNLSVFGPTNWRPRIDTGLELQMFLPVVNAPFRIYWAYNALRLDHDAYPPVPITPQMFPHQMVNGVETWPGYSWYTYDLAKLTYSPEFLLREPRKTFRFTVATTF